MGEDSVGDVIGGLYRLNLLFLNLDLSSRGLVGSSSIDLQSHPPGGGDCVARGDMLLRKGTSTDSSISS